MLHILLLILKIIGIILAVILGIILLLVGIILFVPIRYEIAAKCDGTVESLRAKVKATWLLHLLRADVLVKGTKLKWQVKAAWIKKSNALVFGERKEEGKNEAKEEQKPEVCEEKPESNQETITETVTGFTKADCWWDFFVDHPEVCYNDIVDYYYDYDYM